MGLVRTIVVATAAAGSLDILSAFVFGALAGRSPVAVLTSVAAGPFGRRVSEMGLVAPGIGLLVHFLIMAAMVFAFVVATHLFPVLLRHPVAAGFAYGLILYGIMYWVVLPARWPTTFPQKGSWDVANALFSHLLCVGIPLSLIVSSASGPGLSEGAPDVASRSWPD